MVSVICILIPFVFSSCKKHVTENKTVEVTTNINEEIVIEPVIEENLSVEDKNLEKGEVSIRKNSDGNNEVVYTPNKDVYGKDEFIYKANNGTTYYTVTVNVIIEEPDQITAKNDNISTKEDISIKLAAVLDNDTSGATGVLEFVDFSNIKNGSIEQIDGEYSFIPAEKFNGEGSFIYTIKDSLNRQATASVIVNVTSVSDAPVANEDKVQAFNDESILIDVLENDTDEDEDELYIVSIKNDNNDAENIGTIEIKDNKLYYTPDYKKTGVARFIYTIKDSSEEELQATGILTIGVTSRNDIIEKTINTKEEQAVELSVPGQVLELMDEVQNGNLEVTDMEDAYKNRFYYTPNENFNGEDSFSLYYRSLQDKRVYYMEVKLSVEQVNDAPIAVEDEFVIDEDSSDNVFDVVDNDTDIDEDELIIESIVESDHGTIKIQDNKILYTPDENYNGEESIEYTINDGNGETAKANIKIEVRSINDEPIASDDEYEVDEIRGYHYFDVLNNDWDADGDNLTIEIVENENRNASVEDNKIKYNTYGSFTGEDSITYMVKDGNGGTSKATVKVKVNPMNDAPYVKWEYKEVDEDSGPFYFDVLSNDWDEEGDKLTLTEIQCNSDYDILEIVDNKIKFNPIENDIGTKIIYYTVSDGNGGIGKSYIKVYFRTVNDPPTAVDDEYTIYGDSGTNMLSILSNDYDIDMKQGGYYYALKINSVGEAKHGEVKQGLGAISYIPDNGFRGQDSFQYTLIDKYWGATETTTATVYITVDGPNNAPIAEDDNFEAQEDSIANSFDVLLNDSDANGDKLTIDRIGNWGYNNTTGESSEGGSVTIIKEEILITEEIDGHIITTLGKYPKIVYSPKANFNGQDTIYYKISDGNKGTAMGTINVTVKSENDTPIAKEDEFSADENSESNIFDVLANDSDVDGDILTLESVINSEHSTTAIENNKLVYTPNADFYGTDVINYTINDGNGEKATVTTTIKVNRENVAPIVQDDEFTVNIDSKYNYFDVLVNDTDMDGDNLSIESIGQGENGTAQIWLDTIIYTPKADFSGTDTLTYTVKDGYGGAGTATINITVSENHAPQGNKDIFNIKEDCDEQVLDVLANDSDEDNDELIIEEVHYTWFSDVNPIGDFRVEDNKIYYKPRKDRNGTVNLAYKISDGRGGTTTGNIQIIVEPVSDYDPVAYDDQYQTSEDSSYNIFKVLENDKDEDGDNLTIESVNQSQNSGVSVSQDKKELYYYPNKDFNGEDTFTYTINDGYGNLATATVKVIVESVNDAPKVEGDSFEVDEDTQGNIFNVLDNDWDVDGDNLTIESVVESQNGVATIGNIEDGNNTIENKTIVYTPNKDFNGQDSITYTVNDGNSGKSTATINITVKAVNDAPVAEADQLTLDEDSVENEIDVLSNDWDVDGDNLTIESVVESQNGKATIGDIESGNNTIENKTIIYTPKADFSGEDVITYTINDGNGKTSSATVNIIVNNINDAPKCGNHYYTVNENSEVTVLDVLKDDTDADSDQLTIEKVQAAGSESKGTFAIVDNKIQYKPNKNVYGDDELKYTASDGNGGTDIGYIFVTIKSVNEAPIAQNDQYSVDEFSIDNEFDVLLNDLDSDGDTLSITSVDDPEGFATIVNNKVSYNASSEGQHVITYTITDGKGATCTATVTIIVNSVNHAPVAKDDKIDIEMYSVNTLLIDVLANDSDADNDILTIDSVTKPIYDGEVFIEGNKIRYAPYNYDNGIDSFTYTIKDENGLTSTATVEITFVPMNNPPTAQDDQYEVDQGSNYNEFNVVANDEDIDGNILTIESVGESQNAAVEIFNNQILYTPIPWFTGQDTITYKINDGKGYTSEATMYVTVNQRDTIFEAKNDKYEVESNSINDLNVLSNDLNWSGNTFWIESASDNTIGSASLVGRSIEYSSYGIDDETYDSFTYTIKDAIGQTSTAKVFVHVIPADE